MSGVHLLLIGARTRRPVEEKMVNFIKDLANFCGLYTLLLVVCIHYTNASKYQRARPLVKVVVMDL